MNQMLKTWLILTYKTKFSSSYATPFTLSRIVGLMIYVYSVSLNDVISVRGRKQLLYTIERSEG